MTAWLLLVALLAPDAALPDAGAPDAAAAPAAAAPATPPPAAPPPASGPPPEITLDCAPDPVRIGEPLVCTLTALHAPDVSVTVTAPPALTPEEAPAPPAARDDGRLATVRRFTVRPDSMRKVRVDGVAVIWQEADGAEGRVQVPRETIATRSVLGGAPDPAFRTFTAPGDTDADAFWAAHGPVPYRVFNWPLFIALCVFGAAAVGVGVGLAIKRWLDARVVDDGPPVDPRPAHVIAYEKLDRLAAEALPAQGRVGEHYVRLTEIIRDYLERRFGVDAPEMTSDQIRAWAAAAPLTAEARLGLDDFLAETDLVKFADISPSPSEVDTVTRLARGLVALTRAPETAPGAAPTAEATA